MVIKGTIYIKRCKTPWYSSLDRVGLSFLVSPNFANNIVVYCP